LLWLIQPYFNTTAEVQFGPYAYRSNAAQYFNLLWPACLGFWWILRLEYRRSPRAQSRMGGGPHVMLLPCAVLMAAAPIISTSRGGALVAGAALVLAWIALMIANRRGRWLMRFGLATVFVSTISLGVYLGSEKLVPRLQLVFSDDLSGRGQIYRNARQMVLDYPVFGTGPGTFPWVYHLYRADEQQVLEAYAHDDWLETRVTFGWIGFLVILAMLFSLFARWWIGRGIVAPWLFVSMLWLSLAGCLVHAKFDFPFQVYSTLALFLHLGVVLFCLSRKS
jgi:O-antigen ligase